MKFKFVKISISSLLFLFYCQWNSGQQKTEQLVIDAKYSNLIEQKAFVRIKGNTFQTELESDWKAFNPDRGSYPRNWTIYDIYFRDLKFGFNSPWDWIFDLSVYETDKGIVTVSKGYQTVIGGRIPYSKIIRFFWNKPEMLYEVSESFHIDKNKYIINITDSASVYLDSQGSRLCYSSNGIDIWWQFNIRPLKVEFDRKKGFIFTFDKNRIETLVTWGEKGSYKLKSFLSVSKEVEEIRVSSTKEKSRIYMVNEKHTCIEPDESFQLLMNDYMLTGVDETRNKQIFLKPGLHELAIRKIEQDTIKAGGSTLFSLNSLVESPSTPQVKSFLIRALRSLNDRIIYGIVTEDDPTQGYLWGTGTWPRCYSILCLDYFDLHEEAFNYLEYMLDISKQFIFKDKIAHLWDSFFMTGERRDQTLSLYDINGHSIKLFEAGKFYLNHRNDQYGRKILENHYETLKEWCLWIELHINDKGLILDCTESNIWSMGYGVFTQSPAIAGIKLFTEIAKDKNMRADVDHFTKTVERLVNGMDNYLYGDCENEFLNIPEGAGMAYITSLPSNIPGPGFSNKRIGLSCYSLAPHFFLLDPDVKLLNKNDPKIVNTLKLSMQYLDDANDKRIITWFVRNNLAHIGYGQGQLLMSLIYGNQPDEFRKRLKALFDITEASIGDKYLLPEVLGRPDTPNKGNKAHLTYYPYIIAYLSGISHNGGILKEFIPDIIVKAK